jgi:hypothetical protein
MSAMGSIFTGIWAYSDQVSPNAIERNIMARVANEYAVYLLLSGGHREEVRFPTMQEFQKWYSNELMPKSSSTDFMTVPLKNAQGEYMLVRPGSIEGIRIEPVFASSVDRDY